MQTTIFKKLYTLTFDHVRAKVVDSIQLVPDINTLRLLKNYKLLFKQKGNAIYIAQTIVGSKPLVEIDTELNFRFFIKFNYVDVVHGSELPLYNAKDSCIYIRLDKSFSGEIFEINETCVIPILKEIGDNKVLIDHITNEEVPVNEISDGVYSLKSDPEIYRAYFTLKNHGQCGFLDIQYVPDQEKSDQENEISFKLTDRETLLEYHIFDKNNTYSNYAIESEIEGITFNIIKSDKAIVIRSNLKLTMAEIEKAKFVLLAERKNGRQVTLKEKMQVPTSETLYKLENNGDVYIKSFFYV